MTSFVEFSTGCGGGVILNSRYVVAIGEGSGTLAICFSVFGFQDFGTALFT